MARYAVQQQSAAALASGGVVGYLVPTASVGFKLRRMTLGVVAGATTPTSQQLVVGINRITAAGTGAATAGNAIGKLDPNTAAANTAWNLSYATTAPTLSAVDQFQTAFNSQSGVDLPWELLEEFIVAAGTANGLAIVNRNNALPASHSLVVSLEFEE